MCYDQRHLTPKSPLLLQEALLQLAVVGFKNMHNVTEERTPSNNNHVEVTASVDSVVVDTKLHLHQKEIPRFQKHNNIFLTIKTRAEGPPSKCLELSNSSKKDYGTHHGLYSLYPWY